MAKQLNIGVCPPNAFRETEAIAELYQAKREYLRRSILAQMQGDAHTVMECTAMVSDIDCLIYELQKTAS
jgi:hypothetical protein